MINEALRLIRVFHDMSQKEAAQKLGLSQSYLSELEKDGRKVPTIEVLKKYADAFDIPVSSIMFFSESLETKSFHAKTQRYVSTKILKLLDYIAAKSGRVHV